MGVPAMARALDVDDDDDDADDALGLSLSVFCFFAAGAGALLPVMRRSIMSRMGMSSSLSDASSTGRLAILGGAAAAAADEDDEDEDDEADDDAAAVGLLAGAAAGADAAAPAPPTAADAALLSPFAPPASFFTCTSLLDWDANLAFTISLMGLSSSSSLSPDIVSWSSGWQAKVSKQCNPGICTDRHAQRKVAADWRLARLPDLLLFCCCPTKP